MLRRTQGLLEKFLAVKHVRRASDVISMKGHISRFGGTARAVT